MTYALKKPPASDLRKPFVGSLLLHATVVAVISLALLRQAASIDAQEAAAIEKLKQQEQNLSQAEADAEQAFQREMTQQSMLQEMSTILSDDINSDALQKLQDQLETDLAALFQDQNNFDDETLQEMRLAVIDTLAAEADALLIDAIIAQIRGYIKVELAPILVAELERSLKQHGANTLRKAINVFIRQHKAQAQVATIIQEAIDPIHQSLADAIKQSINNDIVPPATEKVLDRFVEEINAYQISGERLRPLISADISKAIIEALLELNSNERIATLHTRVEHQLTGDEKLTALQKEITEHITDVEELMEQQDALDKHIEKEDDQALAASDKQINDLQRVYDAAAKTLHQAETENTSHHNWKVSKARSLADLERAIAPNQKANLHIQLENKEQALKDSTYANNHLKEFVQHMHNAQAVLQQEIDKRSTSQKAAPATEAEKTKATALHQAVQDEIQTLSADSSRSAIEKMKVQDILGELGDELEAAIELTHKIAQAKEKLEQGRELDNSSLIADINGLLPGRGGVNQHRLQQQRINREAYEAYVKDLKQRSQLGNAYQPSERIDQAQSRAQATDASGPATVFISPAQKEALHNQKTNTDTERQLVQPEFKSLAFGAASFCAQTLRIDGDLSDWGTLEHPMHMQYYADDAEQKINNGIPLYMQWSNKGLYFCYQVLSTHTPVIPSRRAPYSGDVLEVWLDVLNTRDLNMKISQSAHQFLLCPFGLRDAKGSMTEYGRGSRGLLTGKIYLDETEQHGIARARQNENGYTVEGFISVNALAKPVLTPGMYLAANFSINQQSFAGKYATQWSASKAMETQNKPDTWGDIVLLGSDGSVQFEKANTKETDIFYCVGDNIAVRVEDPDMNMRADIKDRVTVTLSAAYSQQELLLILEEDAVNSGVFRGSCASQAAFRSAQPNTIGIEQGDIITATYTDARAAFGESNRAVKTAAPVAWTVFAQSKQQ